jgi:surface protein
MKSIKNFINEALKINSNSKVILNKKIKPKDSEELREIIFNRIKEASNNETYILDCTDIDISHFKSLGSVFSNINDIDYVHTIDITGWDTSNVENMYGMFSNALYIEKIIGIEDLDVSNVRNMQNMFLKCERLKELNLEKWDVSNVNTMRSMFLFCHKNLKLKCDSWNLNRHVNLLEIFTYWKSNKLPKWFRNFTK